MMMKRKTLPLLLIVLLVSSQTSWAAVQQTSAANNWTAVQQLGTDEKVVVKRKDGKEFKGRMIEASETTLRIDRNGKPFEIARADVRRVDVVERKAQKGKWTLIGAGAGAATGAGIGGIQYSPDRDDSAIYIGAGMLLGAGIGAVSGLVFGQTRRKRTTVYAID
jgi:hypothetical protein